MEQNHKDLLLKDLCSRLPYGVKFACNKNIYTAKGIDLIVTDEGGWEYAVTAKGIAPIEIDYIKPYLFPLSSMTEEHHKEYRKACLLDIEILEKHPMNGEPFPAQYNSQDWLSKEKFDYRGLIPMGLAIDATNLNIY